LNRKTGKLNRKKYKGYFLYNTEKNEATTGLWFDFAHHPELVEGRPWYPPLLRRNPPTHHPALPLRVIHCSHSSTALPPWHLAKADKKTGGWILSRPGQNPTVVKKPVVKKP